MQVTVQKASDGSFHETFAAFKAHEEKLLLNSKLHHAELNLKGLDLSPDAAKLFVMQNAAVLREALNASVVTQRKPRGPNKPKEGQ